MEVVPVTPERWDDLVELFERKGPRGGTGMAGSGCWCMWWRHRTGSATANKRALGALVGEGREPGLLAYDDGIAVGWVSVGPREEFGQLVRSRKYGPTEDERGVWSIVCFYVHASARHRGVAEALLAGAVEHARSRGATAVEAYPHVRGDYMGAPELFERHGFETVREVEPRLVVRRSLSGARRRARGRDRAAR